MPTNNKRIFVGALIVVVVILAGALWMIKRTPYQETALEQKQEQESQEIDIVDVETEIVEIESQEMEIDSDIDELEFMDF